MANFIARFIHSSMARGFYTWLDDVKENKQQKRFLRSTIRYWIKNSEAKAFRTWAQNAFKSKEGELQRQLQAKEHQRKALQRQKEEEEKQQSQEVAHLQEQLKDASALKEQLRGNYEKALETHIGRVHSNTYIEKRRNIFCVWADYVKQEKNAVHIIGAIARKHMRMEVFSRIRLAARENFLDSFAQRTLETYGRTFKTSLLRQAYSKWRLSTYKDLCTET